MREPVHRPSALGLVVVFSLAILAGCDQERKLSYFTALEPEGSGEGVAASDGEGGEGCTWHHERFETFAGVELPIRRIADSRWDLGFDEIVAVEIYEATPPLGIGEPRSYVFVQLKLTEEALRSFDAIQAKGCGDYWVVREGSRDLDFVPIAAYVKGAVPGGSFRSREDAERFYAAFEGRVAYVELSGERRAYWRDRNREVQDLVVWYAKCDPEKLKELGDGLYEQIESAGLLEQMKRARCETDPPEITLEP